jgi:organic hydroperoxide reductase OsmC/OhrA
MADERHVYKTSLRWEAQRYGVLSSEGLPSLQVATPPSFPGGQEGIWSPEHFFIAAAEACLMTTFLAIAANSKLEFSAYHSEAEGLLEKTAVGFMVTEIVIRARHVIGDPSATDKARHLMEKAEQHCLISKSMKSSVRVIADVVTG